VAIHIELLQSFLTGKNCIIFTTLKIFKMNKIDNKTQYEKSLERIDELLQVVDNQTPEHDKSYIELDLLSDLVAEYEEEYYPVDLN